MTDVSDSAYRTTRKVLFQHCDPAGIVFYPRYFELINAVVEEWFEEGLGASFAELHTARRMGVPLVHTAMDFCAPSRLGDTLMFALSVERVSGASVHLNITAHGGDELRLEGRLVLAHMNLDTARAVPFPGDLADAMRRFQSVS